MASATSFSVLMQTFNIFIMCAQFFFARSFFLVSQNDLRMRCTSFIWQCDQAKIQSACKHARVNILCISNQLRMPQGNFHASFPTSINANKLERRFQWNATWGAVLNHMPKVAQALESHWVKILKPETYHTLHDMPMCLLCLPARMPVQQLWLQLMHQLLHWRMPGQ